MGAQFGEEILCGGGIGDERLGAPVNAVGEDGAAGGEDPPRRCQPEKGADGRSSPLERKHPLLLLCPVSLHLRPFYMPI